MKIGIYCCPSIDGASTKPLRKKLSRLSRPRHLGCSDEPDVFFFLYGAHIGFLSILGALCRQFPEKPVILVRCNDDAPRVVGALTLKSTERDLRSALKAACKLFPKVSG